MVACESCGAHNKDTSKFCKKCGKSLGQQMPAQPAPPHAPGARKEPLLVSLLAVVLLALGGLLFAIFADAGRTGGAVCATVGAPPRSAQAPVAPEPKKEQLVQPRPGVPKEAPKQLPAARLQPYRFPNYGIEVSFPQSWRQAAQSEVEAALGSMKEELTREIELLGIFTDAKQTGAILVAASQQPMDIKPGTLELKGRMVFRDLSDPSSPPVQLRAETIAGVPAMTSNIISRRGTYVGFIVLLSRPRMFILAAVSDNKAAAAALFPELRRAAERTQFFTPEGG